MKAEFPSRRCDAQQTRFSRASSLQAVTPGSLGGEHAPENSLLCSSWRHPLETALELCTAPRLPVELLMRVWSLFVRSQQSPGCFWTKEKQEGNRHCEKKRKILLAYRRNWKSAAEKTGVEMFIEEDAAEKMLNLRIVTSFHLLNWLSKAFPYRQNCGNLSETFLEYF